MTNTLTTDPPKAAEPASQSETLLQQISRTYYDLLPAFEAASRVDAPALYNHWEDEHWTAAGHGVAAEVVAQHLGKRIALVSPSASAAPTLSRAQENPDPDAGPRHRGEERRPRSSSRPTSAHPRLPRVL